MKCIVVLLVAVFACALGLPLSHYDENHDNAAQWEAMTDDELLDEIIRSNQSPLPDGRIVGGENARIQDFPWQLSLRVATRHVCGASIISATRALTAAHCYLPRFANQYNVQAGSTTRNGDPGSVRVNVQRFIPHPQYNSRTINNDVAVLWLAQALTFGPTIRAIRIAEPNAPAPYGATAIVAGWGNTREGDNNSSPNILQSVQLPVITNQQCNQSYRGRVLDGMICAGRIQGGQNTCQGDSGGALVSNGVQYGVVSWAIGCARPRFPTVFARVPAYTTWVRSVL